jgi:hypothetical protein
MYCTETNGQQVSLFLCQLASEFSELVSRLSDFEQRELFEISMESLILAQDERWRRA